MARKHLYLVIGRFSPVTKAHVDMILLGMKQASYNRDDFKIVMPVSKELDERSPFPPTVRCQLLRRYFDETVKIHVTGNVYESILSFCEDYDYITLICGPDRHESYKGLIKRLKSTLDCAPSFYVMEYRYPEGRSQVSATKAREYLKNRQVEQFTNIMHDSIPFLSRLYIYETLIPFIDEANNGSQQNST